jgi:thiol-disulfide isomerase/thioredoxin
MKQGLLYFLGGLLAAFLIVFARFSMNQLIVDLSCGIVFFISGVMLGKMVRKVNSKINILLFLSFPLYVLAYSAFTNFPFIFFLIIEAILLLLSFFTGLKYADKLLPKKIIAFCCIILISTLAHIFFTPFARYMASKIEARRGNALIAKRTNFSFIDEKGDTLHQSNYNNSVILIDYWFIGCKPCYEKMQALAEIRNTYKDNDNVKIIAIDAATGDSYSEFLEVCKSFPKGIIYGYDTTNETKLKFMIESYPTEILINKDGYVEQYSSGFNLDYKEKYIKETQNKIYALLRKN